MIFEKIDQIKQEALTAFSASKTVAELYEAKTKFLGKKGTLSAVMQEMRNVPPENRPKFGQKVNEAKTEIESKYEEFNEKLKTQELNSKILSEKIDVTLPGLKKEKATLHPIQIVLNEMADIFSRLGFSVRIGPMIEKDYYNFEALNIPKDHPARDMQDTFYISESHVLRTQTSPIQIRTMEKEKPPIRIIAPGAVFRHDSDVSHLPMFHQVEGLYIDKKVSMADLKGTLSFFNQQFFGKGLKTRFRPSFFPFTEPSAEVDCSCPLCKGQGCRMCQMSGWVEVCGCGLVHPNVLSQVGLDNKEWQGFAFGMGVERLAIIKYGIEDIRLITENDLRFLRQFTV